MRIPAFVLLVWLTPSTQAQPPLPPATRSAERGQSATGNAERGQPATGSAERGQPATGSAERGKMLFTQRYRCYACHGYSGETGMPRLVPTPRTQESFVTYARKPATPGMPSYAHAPTQDLVDIYAFVRSIRPDAQPVDRIPLLSDILRRRQR